MNAFQRAIVAAAFAGATACTAMQNLTKTVGEGVSNGFNAAKEKLETESSTTALSNRAEEEAKKKVDDVTPEL